jgi:hypothetical protein
MVTFEDFVVRYEESNVYVLFSEDECSKVGNIVGSSRVFTGDHTVIPF